MPELEGTHVSKRDPWSYVASPWNLKSMMLRLFWISISISLKIAPIGLLDNTSLLVQVVAWRRSGSDPAPGPMVTKIYDTHGVTKPQ